jgi:nitroimidazol reductase NimA-like FMN-containing flavoprotein (pyridoxamine 5'-phosphate oxidase superfamily)
MLGAVKAGSPLCVSATIIDALVFARSAFHHSMNYRSVVVLARGAAVDDDDEKCAALEAMIERVSPGRWAEARRPSTSELRATLVVSLPIDEASAKVRTGPPIDDEDDYALPVWAGELPLRIVPGEPVDDGRLIDGVQPTATILGWGR